MSKNQAVVVVKPGEARVEEASVPKLRDDYILVKTKAVALNPTDWKHVDFLTSKGSRVSSLFRLEATFLPVTFKKLTEHRLAATMRVS